MKSDCMVAPVDTSLPHPAHRNAAKVQYPYNESVRYTDRTFREDIMCWLSGGEPTLDEMLSDQTVITLMKRDSVDPDDLRVLLREMSRRLKRDVPSTVQSPDAASAQPTQSRAWEVSRVTPTRAPAHHSRAREGEPASGGAAQVPARVDGVPPEG